MLRVCTSLPLLSLIAGVAWSEVHTLTLQQALAIAARQNPDVLLARLDSQHAAAGIDVARDPFSPRFAARSDAVYTSGYPNNVNGHSPSLLAGQVDLTLYDRARRYQIAASREQVAIYDHTARGKLDDVAYRIALLFLDAQSCAQAAEIAAREVASLEKAATAANARVQEGYALPVDARQAQVDFAAVRQKAEAFQLDEHYPETLLATALGFSGNDRVHPAAAARDIVLPEESEDKAADAAMTNNQALLSLQASAFAKRIELHSYRNTHTPQVNLVAQYSLIQKSTYESYFPTNLVQRNNGEIGADFILPLLVGTAPIGRLLQAQTDLEKLQLQIYQLRNRITADTRRAYQQLKKAQEWLDVSRQRSEIATGDLSLALSLSSEGRIGLTDLEKTRTAANDREIAVRQAEIDVEKAKLEILRQLGVVAVTLSR